MGAASRARSEDADEARGEDPMDRAVTVMRRCAETLLDAGDPRAAIAEALRAFTDVLDPLGVIESGLVELALPARTVRCTLLIRGGELQDIAGTAIDRPWSIDEPPMSVVWKRACEDRPFVWGLTSDPTVLIAEARAFHEAMGVRAVGYVPLKRGAAPVGWIVMSFRETQPPSPRQVQLVQTLAAYVQLAIELDRVATRSREAALAQEREMAARERAAELAEANAVLRKAVTRFAEASDPASMVREALASISEALSPSEVIDVALIEYVQATRSVRIRAILRHGVEVPLDGVDFASVEWSVDEPQLALPWKRIQNGRFLWGVLGDETILHPAAREFHEASGAKSIAYQPLMIGSDAIGWVAFVLRSEVAPEQPRIALMQMLASQVFLAIEMQRLSEAARAAAIARERQAVAEERVAALALTNTALTAALTRIANEPVSRAPELLLVEVARAADAAVCYWFEHDPVARTLAVVLRVEDGRLREGPASDEPEIFLAPFPSDVTPAFAVLCGQEAFTTVCSRSETPLMWPGTLAWHRRHGREEALAFALRVGDETLGLVGMAFTRAGTMDDVPKQYLVRALANQFALALKLGRLAKAAESAAVERARSAEIETANHVMRNAVDRLAKEPELESFLGFVLLEIASQLGSDTAAITPFSEATDAFHAGVTLHAGKVTPLGSLRSQVKRADARFLDRLRQAAGFAIFDIEAEPELFWPGAVDYLRGYGKRYSMSFAILVDGRLYGQISLAYAERPRPTAQQTALVQALCTQAALAIQLTRLADESRAAETASAIADERNRMAGEIHDSLAQSFTSIALQSESLIADLDEHSPLLATLEVIEQTARLGLAEARRSVLALRPIGDGVGELQHALEQLAERCNIAGSMSCEFRTCTVPCPLSADVRDSVLRVAQEAVNNALRHSKAQRLIIAFDVHDRVATLTVTDNGVGVAEPARQPRGGFGIAGMRARAESLGGTLTLSASTAEGGTTVRMRVSCDAERAGSS